MGRRELISWGVLCCCFCILSPAGSDETERAGRQLQLFFADPAFARAFWGVKVQSADSGEVFYQENSDKFVVPASNMKLLTAVAAVEKLGWDYRFETLVATDGKISGGVLHGNLIIVGSGDPTLGARLTSPDLEEPEKGDPVAVFRRWAKKLKSMGVRRIEGDIIGDGSVFDGVALGRGWAWDDLVYGYASEICGLQFNENVVLVEMTPAEEVGGPPALAFVPATSYLQIENRLKTVDAGEDWEFEVKGSGKTNHVVLEGTLPVHHSPLWQAVAVDQPIRYFVSVLKETLESAGIAVRGKALDSKKGPSSSDVERKVLFAYQSPDLRYLIRVLLKVSQNLYAETLVKTLDPHLEGKSYERGRAQVEGVLTRIGIPPESYSLVDGSGLSRSNFVTAESLVRLLRHVYRGSYRDQFLDSLPIAGEDGTLSERMKGTAAQNNVRAKTGTLGHVRALSGFVRTKDNETLAFAMIVNHYSQPRRSAEYLQDLALEFLANFSRK